MCPAVNHQHTPMAQPSSKTKCAQLGVPGNETLKVSGNNNNNNTGTLRDGTNQQPQQQQESSDTVAENKGQSYRYLFEDNKDRLKSYIRLVKHYNCHFKCFSTSEINEVGRTGKSEFESFRGSMLRRSHSETDLFVSNEGNSNNTGKDITNDYVTYSCSTLAICGDTLHSSQLPSPQTQSIRQINSLIFTDDDLIKSLNKNVRDQCIRRRILELVKSGQLENVESLDRKELLSSNINVLLKRLKYASDFDAKEFMNEKGEISINVAEFDVPDSGNNKPSWTTNKVDKNSLVLSWLQSVGPTSATDIELDT